MKDRCEKAARNGDLRHLKRDIATVAHDLRADLDQLFLQARERPVLDRLGRGEGAQEVAEIVGERMKLKPDGVGGERAAGKPRPSDRALALFDPLFAGSAGHSEGVPRALDLGDDGSGFRRAWLGRLSRVAEQSCTRILVRIDLLGWRRRSPAVFS